MKEFEGKTAIITGGANGIGKAAAILFAHEGAKIALADTNEKEGKQVVKQITDNGGEAFFMKTDVSSSLQVRSMVEETVNKYGKLDIAFNNAGIGSKNVPTAEKSEDEWEKVLSVNLTGVFLCMKYEIPHMLKQGKGVIVNTSSVAGVSPLSLSAAYTASKYGVVGLSKSTALAYRKSGIRVNVVCPGFIRTQLTKGLDSILDPEELFGEPIDIAKSVLWLCSDESRFITGHALVVDGGYTLDMRWDPTQL